MAGEGEGSMITESEEIVFSSSGLGLARWPSTSPGFEYHEDHWWREQGRDPQSQYAPTLLSYPDT